MQRHTGLSSSIIVLAALMWAAMGMGNAVVQADNDADIEKVAKELRAELEKVREIRRDLKDELDELKELRKEMSREITLLRQARRDVKVDVDDDWRDDHDWHRDRDWHQPRNDAVSKGVVVTVRDGKLDFQGKHREYQPFAFEIMAGESRWVTYVDEDYKRQDRVQVTLSKDGRTLLFGSESRKPLRYIDDGWDKGRKYDARSEEDAGAEPQRIVLEIRSTAHRRGVIVIDRDRH